jgi:hypothetical protein
MTDIAERLREIGKLGESYGWGRDTIWFHAADEIEKLHAAVQDLAKHIWRGDWDKLKPETRKLLGEKE